MKPIVKKMMLTCFVLLISVLVFIHFFAPRIIIQVHSPFYYLLTNLRLKPDDEKQPKDPNHRSLKIETPENLQLSVLVGANPDIPSKGTIIFLHGIRGFKEHFLQPSKWLMKNGYNTVLVDLRAHGQSEGKYCSFGYHEKHDIQSVINYIIHEPTLNNNIGIWGQSLGAAIALQTMAIDKRLKFGIIESTFSDFRTIVGDYFLYHLNWEAPWLTQYLISRTESIAHFSAPSVMPKESAKLINQPIIMSHGSADKRISIKYGRENYNNLASQNKEWIEITGANHLNVWAMGGDSYFIKILSFINSLPTRN